LLHDAIKRRLTAVVYAPLPSFPLYCNADDLDDLMSSALGTTKFAKKQYY